MKKPNNIFDADPHEYSDAELGEGQLFVTAVIEGMPTVQERQALPRNKQFQTAVVRLLKYRPE